MYAYILVDRTINPLYLSTFKVLKLTYIFFELVNIQRCDVILYDYVDLYINSVGKKLKFDYNF